MIIMAIQYAFTLWKYTIVGEHPLLPRPSDPKTNIASKIASGVAHAVADKVAGSQHLVATLHSGEAVAAIAVLVGLVGLGLLFAILHYDGVASAVFGWGSLGVSCHARTLGTASRLAASGFGPVLTRLASLASRVGIHGIWGLGGKGGEGWWTVIHDVALAAAIAHGLIALVTFVVKCRRQKSLRGKALGYGQ